MYIILAGSTQEEGVPHKRKKDFLDDSSKSTNRSSRKEIGKEEIKWQTDDRAGYTVGSADGELAFFKVWSIFGKVNCRSVSVRHLVGESDHLHLEHNV
jgi:hypothetical protein